MNNVRVEVGVGSVVRVLLHKFHARMVSLSGMQPKCEVTNEIIGTITNVELPENNETTPEGKPNYRFDLKSRDGHTYKLKRADIKFCDLISET